MINTVAFDISIMLKNCQHDFLTHYLQSLDALKDRPNFLAIEAALKEFLEEIDHNSEYISNRLLFKRMLANHFREDDVENVSSILQAFTFSYIDSLFTKDNINPLFISLINTLQEKMFKLVFIIEPYFNETIATYILAKFGLNISQFDYITTNEYSHYGKNNIRFYHELWEKNHSLTQPDNILLITPDVKSMEHALKLGGVVYFIGENENAKYSGDLVKCLEFIKKLPPVLSHQQ